MILAVGAAAKFAGPVIPAPRSATTPERRIPVMGLRFHFRPSLVLIEWRA
jgi:hypothetical protein